MVATVERTATPGAPASRPALIDCDLHNELDGDVWALAPYLPVRWRRHLETFGTRSPAGGYYPRFMDHRDDARPPSGRRAGSDVAFTRENYLDPCRVAYGILIPLSPAASQQNLEFGAALATACNDWQVAEWLDPEPRLRASIVIPVEAPDLAVAEIRRRAADKRFVQVQFTGRPQEPMGRRKYWPIYEECAELGLKLISHAFGSYGNPVTGAGRPSFYLEDHVGPAQAMQANIISLVAEGVFDRFPELQVISVENGYGWLPSLCWRLDAAWSLLKDEVPHLSMAPSEYVRRHLWATTQPMEEPHHAYQFGQMLDHLGPLADRILFASDYPHWDADQPDAAFPVHLSQEQAYRFYYGNAAGLYGLE